MMNFIRRFPVQVAIGALLIYAVTLSHGVTMNSLLLAAKVAGWDWTPMVGQPLLWLVTLPLRLLPAAWVPPCLNLFSATTAALTLGLLARTVQLLPWDRPWDDANRGAGALPVLLACAVCGLEFSFLQEATAATGEMLDMLLLAAALWLMLEYRVRRESRWLDAAVFIWGLGMAENWLMLLALPFFVCGVIWLLGLRFLLDRRIEEKMDADEPKLQWILIIPAEFLAAAGRAGTGGIFSLRPSATGQRTGSAHAMESGPVVACQSQADQGHRFAALLPILADTPGFGDGGGALLFAAGAVLSRAVRRGGHFPQNAGGCFRALDLSRPARVAAAGLFVAGVRPGQRPATNCATPVWRFAGVVDLRLFERPGRGVSRRQSPAAGAGHCEAAQTTAIQNQLAETGHPRRRRHSRPGRRRPGGKKHPGNPAK